MKKNMISKEILFLIITSMIILLPMIIGLIMWDKLSNPMIIQFSDGGRKFGKANKMYIVLTIPLVLFVFNLICFFANYFQNGKSLTKRDIREMLFIPVFAIIVLVVLIGGL